MTGYAGDGAMQPGQSFGSYPQRFAYDFGRDVPPEEMATVTGVSLPLERTGAATQQPPPLGSDDIQIAQANDNLPPRWDMFPRDPACIEASHECLSEAPPGRRAECLVAEVGCNAQAEKVKSYDPKDFGTGFFPNGR